MAPAERRGGRPTRHYQDRSVIVISQGSVCRRTVSEKEKCPGVTSTKPLTEHHRLLEWVNEWAALTEPDRVLWCDGSAEEYDDLCADLVAAGTFQRLSDAKRPNSYWA